MAFLTKPFWNGLKILQQLIRQTDESQTFFSYQMLTDAKSHRYENKAIGSIQQLDGSQNHLHQVLSSTESINISQSNKGFFFLH